MTEKTNDVSRAARFTVNFNVECYPSASKEGGEIKTASQDFSFEGEIKNISSSGACLVSNHPLKVSEVIKVSFPIQSSISTYISPPRTLVEVRWTKPVEKGKFVTGLLFLL
jgi:PilZ domain-containing protein